MSSPHILVCSFEYGQRQGPEGICTMRLVHALLEASVRVTVVTSHEGDGGESRPNLNVIKISAECFSPKVFFRFVEKVLGRIYLKNYHQFWQIRVLRTKMPEGIDLVYGRCMPFSSAIAARCLAAQLRKPLLVHFSDPLLSPWYTPPAIPLFLMRRYHKRIVSQARGVSFTTQEAVGYSERTMRLPLCDKAFVLNHVAPEARVLRPRQDRGGPVFLYAGRFYGRRGPAVLLHGFSIFLEEHPDAKFHFFGSSPSCVNDEASRLGIAHSVVVFPFTRDIVSRFKHADVLVAVDAVDDIPVFLSTKIVDYIMVDRLVLVITPKNSPAAKLAERSPKTILAVREDAEAIAKAMNNLMSGKPATEDFRQRFLEMREFSEEVVADTLIRRVEKCVERQRKNCGGPG